MTPIRTAIVSLILLTSLNICPFAQTLRVLPNPDKDPFVGTWKANADKSRPKLDNVNASYVRTVSREGDERVFSTRMRRPHSASFSENHYRILCNGSPHRVPCGNASCTTSCTYVTSSRVEGETLSPDGRTYWAQEVSSDGQEMRIYAYRDTARTKLSSVEVLDRVK
jgi:hypothetical protein